ncbi:potassium channel family protein [Salsipaludibacter albus]|uniref:potassium channel family protein n=1 Tax=Salsipaludibacter albus TaxID=2849650 RepID=UPI002368650E|nr:TrkA family potassium uptake protein [Salsipaludibacter albus]
MPSQFLVIGTGRFGSSIASALYDFGHEVVAIDEDEHALEPVMQQVTHAVVMDATDEEALRKLGIGGFDTVIVAIGENLEASILATVAVRAAGARYVISKADGQLTARVLAAVGADEVVRPEHDMGRRLARQLASPAQVSALELGPDHTIVELETNESMMGTLADLRLPSRFGVQVIAVHREDELLVNPGADFEVYLRDRLVVLGRNDEIAALRDLLAE